MGNQDKQLLSTWIRDTFHRNRKSEAVEFPNRTWERCIRYYFPPLYLIALALVYQTASGNRRVSERGLRPQNTLLTYQFRPRVAP